MKTIKRSKKQDWVTKKINKLNWVFIIAFFTSIIWEIVESFLGHNSHFDLTNLSTWRPREFIFAISTFLLVAENVALLKSKKVDVIKSVEDLQRKYDDFKKGGKDD